MPYRRAPIFLLSPGINTRGTTLPPCWIYSMSRGLVSTNQTFFASEAWILASYKLAALIFTLYIRWCRLWRHTVVWRHDAFFVYRQHSTATKVFMKGLFIVCETVFAIGESQTISHANKTEQQTQERRIQQPANSRRGRFDTEKSSGARTPT